MKVRIPIMIDDPSARGRFPVPFESVVTAEEELFLAGPVTRRVAVLDFDPASGALLPGAPFIPPRREKGEAGSYEVEPAGEVYGPRFLAVSTFATVAETMEMFEERDALGRRLTWAFGAPQLLVVPRAGEWANAYYERESHSLQFFFLRAAGDTPPIFTCLSRDIVAHETAHAILDGIAPSLYHAITPQSLALHEAIADLTALLLSFRSRRLREAVLGETGGSLADSTAFSTVAPELGRVIDPGSRCLRNLNNRKTLDRTDSSIGEDGVPNRVNRFEPHSLSQVLSGALYTVMIKIYDDVRAKSSPRPSGFALFVAAARFKRMILRALDYLPPGEVSFRDYGRAILAADQAAHPADGQERGWICDEFVKRALVASAEELRVETNLPFAGLAEVDLETLLTSDWAAYDFANRHRSFLGIPEGKPFRVLPRLDTTKLYYLTTGADPVPIRELIFKVSWDLEEPSGLGPPFPPDRQITVGTTLAIDFATRAVRGRISSAPGGEQPTDRDGMLRKLLDDGALRLADSATGPDGEPLVGAVRAEVQGPLMRVRGAARLLHLAAEA
jgi:hypothetical protein